MYMSDLIHRNDPVLSYLKIEGMRYLRHVYPLKLINIISLNKHICVKGKYNSQSNAT
jgi:hypothetical protein